MMDRILCFLIRVIIFFSGFARPLSKLGIGQYEEWKPGSRVKILLAGYNGARNTGADARVVAIAKQVKEVFGAENVEITVMTLHRETMRGYFDDDVILQEFSSIFPLDLYKACCRSHAVLLCEGSTLKSTFANALTLFMCEAAGIMARQGKPCIAYGSEIGQMEPFLERAAKRMCRETYFITRTADSQAALDRLGLRGHVGTDTAWFYDGAVSPEAAGELLRNAGWDGKKRLLGIAVIDPFCWPVRASFWKWIRSLVTHNTDGQYEKWYFFSDSPRRRAAFEQYLNALNAAVSRFADEQNAFPVLIGMERLDERACRLLEKKLKRPCAVFLSGNCEAGVMTGILRRLSWLVTSRYHAAVLSMESALPVIAVSMDERLDGIMRELAFEDKYLFHVTDQQLGRRVYAALRRTEKERGMISARISRQDVAYMDKLTRMGAFLLSYIMGELACREHCGPAAEAPDDRSSV